VAAVTQSHIATSGQLSQHWHSSHSASSLAWYNIRGKHALKHVVYGFPFAVLPVCPLITLSVSVYLCMARGGRVASRLGDDSWYWIPTRSHSHAIYSVSLTVSHPSYLVLLYSKYYFWLVALYCDLYWRLCLAVCASLSTQHVRLLGVPLCWPDSLELAAWWT